MTPKILSQNPNPKKHLSPKLSITPRLELYTILQHTHIGIWNSCRKTQIYISQGILARVEFVATPNKRQSTNIQRIYWDLWHT